MQFCCRTLLILGTFADLLHRWSRPKLYIGRDKATLTEDHSIYPAGFGVLSLEQAKSAFSIR